MPGFFSPLANPSGWTFSHELMAIPAGMRYGGYQIRALRCNIATATNILAPFRSALRIHDIGSTHILELQMTPFLDQSLVQALPGGVPTFYLSFPDNSGFAAFENDDFLNGNQVLRNTDSVAIGLVFQDRVVRDPHYWCQLLLDTLTSEGIATTDWAPFNTAVDLAFSGNTSPVLLLNASGSLMQEANVDVVYDLPGGTQTYQLAMIAADFGDLQQTVSRMGLTIPDLWSTDSSFTIRPTVAPGENTEWQFSRLEDASSAEGEIEVTPSLRHIQITHLHNWFAPQYVTASPLSRFSRGNKLVSFINGPEFFDDLFRELPGANSSGNGFHHVGYLIVHDKELIKLKDGDPAGLALKLEDAMTNISDGGGKICLLPSQFIHLNSTTPLDNYNIALMLLLLFALSTAMLLHDLEKEVFSVDFAKIDEVGITVIIILMISTFFIPIVVPEVLIDDDGLVTFEFNKSVRDYTEDLANGRAMIAPYPATTEDNPDFQTNWLIDMGLDFTNRFGIYHQKFSILKNTSGHIAYCGGMDLNTDRLDDENHMAKTPYHDTHARVEGPAVTDIAQTFDERWRHEAGSGTDLAFSVPATAALGSPGNQIIQVGRTYFEPSASARELPFATNGDRTILDTLLNAVREANEFIYIEDQYLTPPPEFQTALINKVQNREIQKLIIVVPDDTDQPFGDIERRAFIEALALAESTLPPEDQNILHIGYPRRNYHLPDNKTRASSGKCILEADLPKNPTSMIDEEVTLGRGTRLPGVPFYMSIEGEIIYAYKLKDTLPTSGDAEDPDTARQTKRVYKVLRGDKLPDMGTKRIAHKKGAAVSILKYSSIYVHSSVMIVDDMFLSLGSANLNERGCYHDGEANIFTIPGGLRNGAENPVRDLRLRLWADMLNLPREMAGGLLRDPIAAAELFTRSPQYGNRFVNLVDKPPLALFGPSAGTSSFPMILTSLAAIFVASDLTYDKFYETLVDPASGLKP